MSSNKEPVCCPKFNPIPWEKKITNWKNKKFIKDKVFTFFFIPINFGQVITKMSRKVDSSGAKFVDNVCLSDHTSKWNMDLYVAVDRKVDGAQNVTISGKFLTKVYEGDFKDTGVWAQDFESYAKSKKVTIKKMYMWYTTCPGCAKKYGRNYVVIFGQL
jgi:hypothetical protein